MKGVLIASVAAGLLVGPAGAAKVDPRVFVLSQADVPAGFAFDKSNSLLISKASLDRHATRDKEALVLVRAGFSAGYTARYRNVGPPRWRYVDSLALVFRTARGSRTILAWMRKQSASKSAAVLRRIALGDEAWFISSGRGDSDVGILWRYRNVVALVSCSQVSRPEALTVALARKQQERIAAALR